VNRESIYWMLNLYHFVNDAIVMLIPTLMATFYDLFQLNFTQTGIILATNLGMIVVFQITNGYIADKNKEKYQYIIGLSLVIISTFLLLFSHDFYSLWLFSAISGFALGFVHAIIYVLGAKLYPKDREKKMSKQGAWGDLGKMVAIMSSAIILIIEPTAWKIPFIIWGSIAIIILIVALNYIPFFNFRELIVLESTIDENSQKNIEDNEKIESESPGQVEAATGNKRIVILLYLLFILYSGAQEVTSKFFTVYLHVARTGPSASYEKVIFAFLMGFGTIGTYYSGQIKDKIGFRKYLSIIYSINIITLILFIVIDFDNIISDIIFAMIIGYSVLSVYIVIQTEISYYIHFKKLGLGYGLLLGIGWFGGFLSTLFVGYLADIFGPKIFFIFAIILGISEILLIQIIPQRKNRKVP
jgi:MFS transporter, FSR family, fosmidomycin resistance protein